MLLLSLFFFLLSSSTSRLARSVSKTIKEQRGGCHLRGGGRGCPLTQTAGEGLLAWGAHQVHAATAAASSSPAVVWWAVPSRFSPPAPARPLFSSHKNGCIRRCLPAVDSWITCTCLVVQVQIWVDGGSRPPLSFSLALSLCLSSGPARGMGGGKEKGQEEEDERGLGKKRGGERLVCSDTAAIAVRQPSPLPPMLTPLSLPFSSSCLAFSPPSPRVSLQPLKLHHFPRLWYPSLAQVSPSLSPAHNL